MLGDGRRQSFDEIECRLFIRISELDVVGVVAAYGQQRDVCQAVPVEVAQGQQTVPITSAHRDPVEREVPQAVEDRASLVEIDPCTECGP